MLPRTNHFAAAHEPGDHRFGSAVVVIPEHSAGSDAETVRVADDLLI